MSTWLRIATGTAAGPVCIAVTVIGLYLSYLAWRRKGARSAMRGIAWSLLPTVAWLTGSAHLIGQIGSAIVQFAQSFALSPKAWLGVVLVALAVVLFMVSGGIPMLQRGHRRNRAVERSESAGGAGGSVGKDDKSQEKAAIAPAAKRRSKPKADDDDDMSDVQDILRRHGIS